LTQDLYKLLQEDVTQVVVELSDKEHPIFQAHFPNYPILPGFLLIEIFCEVLKCTPKRIISAKFISHSNPKDTLYYTYEKKAEKTKVKVLNQNNEKVGEFSYE